MYGECTMSAVYGCRREGKYGTLNPILSAKLRSFKGIKYGKVEIMAKLPRGDWIWPGMLQNRLCCLNRLQHPNRRTIIGQTCIYIYFLTI